MTELNLQVNGFSAHAVEAGIKYKNRLDLGIIVAETAAVAAGVFTTSLVKAAPVQLSMERLAGGHAQVVLVNSGNANACTGKEGMAAARQSTELVARALNIDESLILPASTGVIGMPLPVQPFAGAIEQLVSGLSVDGFARVGLAIMTTDTVPKSAVRLIELDGRPVKIAGICKGAGMIMPNMATMLCFILTDAVVEAPFLRESLRDAVAGSFNALTIDGDTSTNDTAIVLASGKAGNQAPAVGSPEATAFTRALHEVCLDLAKQIARDGEGATKFVTVRVRGAVSEDEAKTAAFTVANSPLVKTAFFGEDANWGRIMAALGRSGATFDPGKVSIAFGDALLVQNGRGLGQEAEARATTVLKTREFNVIIDLGAGDSNFDVYTCDYSIDYIKINADYRS